MECTFSLDQISLKVGDRNQFSHLLFVATLVKNSKVLRIFGLIDSLTTQNEFDVKTHSLSNLTLTALLSL